MYVFSRVYVHFFDFSCNFFFTWVEWTNAILVIFHNSEFLYLQTKFDMWGVFWRSFYTANANVNAILCQFFNNEAPDMQDAPFYVISESYGGKMAAAYGVALHKGNDNHNII